jgi:tetratricopeptide (TPR) repeat protein
MAELPTPGQVITFYSYKGGTGRTMALANVACLLARGSFGREGLLDPLGETPSGPTTVLAIDWDLEAPGLHQFLESVLSIPARDVDDRPGLIDLLIELDQSELGRASGGGAPDEDPVQAGLRSIELDRFVLETTIPGLSFMKAGRFDDGYGARVTTFDWDRLYRRVPGLFTGLARYLSERFSYVLIDSRTGVSDTSGICTTLLPERLVVVFTPNMQSMTGIVDLVRSATNYRRQSQDLRPLVVFPLASRVEPARPALLEHWRRGSDPDGFVGFQPQFEKIFGEIYELPECDLTAYFDEVQLQHVPDYAYGEPIAVEMEQSESRLSLKRSYESFTQRLVLLAGPWIDPDAAALERFLDSLRVRADEALEDGNLTLATQLLHRALGIHQDAAKVRAPELSSSLQNLGRKLRDEGGQLEEAETLFRGALDAGRRAFGAEHPKVASYLEDLGDLRARQGHLEEGRRQIEDALHLQQKVFGPEHLLVADTSDRLAHLYAQLGRLEESRALFERSLAIRRAILGSADPDVAVSLANLAMIAKTSGRLPEAEQLYQEALKIRASEGDDAFAGEVLDSLGWLNLSRGDLKRAERYFEQAVETRSAALGYEDPGVATSLDGLGRVATIRHEFEQAQTLYERAQLYREKAFGRSHPDAVRSVINFADLAAAQENWERSDLLYRRALSSVDKELGGDHPLVAEILRKRGDLEFSRRQPEKALDYYKQALGAYERSSNKLGSAATRQEIAEVLIDLGDAEQAEQHLRHALEEARTIGARSNEAGALLQLGLLYRNQHNLMEAEKFCRLALASYDTVGDRRGVALSFVSLGSLKEAADDPQGAEEFRQKAYDIARDLEIVGPDQTSISLDDLSVKLETVPVGT